MDNQLDHYTVQYLEDQQHMSRCVYEVMVSSKAQRRSFDVALKLRPVEFAIKNGKDAVRCGLKVEQRVV